MTPLWTLGEPEPMNAPRVSFIVPVRNDAVRLRDLSAEHPAGTTTAPVTSKSSSSTTDRPTARRRSPLSWARGSSASSRAGCPSCEIAARRWRRQTSWRSSMRTTRSCAGWVHAALECLHMPQRRRGRRALSRAAGRHVGAARRTATSEARPAARTRRTGSAAATWRCRATPSKPSAGSTPRSRPARTSISATGFARWPADRQRRAPEEHPPRRSEDPARSLFQRALAGPRQPPGQLPPAVPVVRDPERAAADWPGRVTRGRRSPASSRCSGPRRSVCC